MSMTFDHPSIVVASILVFVVAFITLPLLLLLLLLLKYLKLPVDGVDGSGLMLILKVSR